MNPCCEAPENREALEKDDTRKVERCRECGAKHYEMAVDPISLGVVGEGV